MELETRLGYPSGRSATRRDFIKLKRETPGECEERISDSVAPEYLPGVYRQETSNVGGFFAMVSAQLV